MDYANLRTIIGDDILPESFEETNGFLRYKNVNKPDPFTEGDDDFFYIL